MLNCNSSDYAPSSVPVTRRFSLKNKDFALPPKHAKSGRCLREDFGYQNPCISNTFSYGRPRHGASNSVRLCMPKRGGLFGGQSRKVVQTSLRFLLARPELISSLMFSPRGRRRAADWAPSSRQRAGESPSCRATSQVTSWLSLRTIRFPSPASRPNAHHLVEVRHPERQ